MTTKRDRILIVDDEHGIRKVLRHKLSSEGYQCHEAGNAAEALEKLDSNPVELVILDIRMPDRSGVDLLPDIKAGYPDTVVIMATVLTDAGTAVQCMKLGAYDYLTKPFDLQEVALSVERALEKRELELANRDHRRHLEELVQERTAGLTVANEQLRREIAERKEAEDALQKAHDELEMRVEERTRELATTNKDLQIEIAERERAQQASQESEHRYRLLAENVTDIIWTTGMNLAFTYVSPSVERVVGYTPEETMALGIHGLLTPASLELAMNTLADELAIENMEIKDLLRSRTLELELTCKDGSTLWAECRMTFLRDQNSQAVSIMGVARDITKRKETERQLLAAETAVRTCNSAIVTADFDGRLTYVNPSVLRVWGYDNSEEVLGKSFTSLYKEEAEARELIEALFTRKHDEKLDFVGKRKDGAEFIAELSAAAILDAEAQFAGFTASVTDITDRMRAQEALQKSELQFRGVINGNADGIAILDKYGVARLVNPAAQAMFNRSAEELVGQMLGLPTVAGETTEVDIVRTDGQTMVAEMQVVEIDWEGEPAYLASLHDITERKKTEEEQRGLDRMKSEFISNISHELRTPLHSIQGFTELMLQGEVPDPATQKRFLAIIDKQSQRLGRLIANLLDVSRLESGRFSIQKQRSSMANIIRDACQSSFALASAKGISINEDIPQTLPEIEVDGERLTQVMINLLGNAIKFSNDGSVTVRAELKNGDLLVQVADQGIGIPKEAMPHLFDRFYRVEDPAEVGGAGLGLYISKQIIEAHGGDLWAESEHREGSTFSFTIPVVSRKRRPKKKIGEILVENGHITKKDLHSALKKQQTQ